MKTLALIAFLFAMSCTGYKQNKDDVMKETYPEQVGDLSPQDTAFANFTPCGEGPFRQYYEFNNGVMFEGEKRGVLDFFKKHFVPRESYSKITGFITIRFLINCKGETGWFHARQVDETLQEVEVSKELAEHLISIVSNLKGWGVPSDGNNSFDYYQYFTFKIENGLIQEISP